MFRAFLLGVLLVTGGANPFTRTDNRNRLHAEAAAAFRAGEYGLAVVLYRRLNQELDDQRPGTLLNAAHAAYLAGDTAAARRSYEALRQHPAFSLRSVAWSQLGLLQYRQGQDQAALGAFRQALAAWPANETARYNYELLLRRQPPPPPKGNPTNPRPGHSGTNAASLSEEAARALLEALERDEVRQLRQKQQRGGEPIDRSLPPW